MASGLDPNARVDLSGASVLILDDNEKYVEILHHILSGFGIRTIHNSQNMADAEAVVKGHKLNLMLVDMVLGAEDGCDWVRWLRRSGVAGNNHAPVIMISAHSAESQVAKVRDCGAHFMVTKPLVPAVLLDRILWVARSSRKFVESDSYVGPDRRFKSIGPPSGAPGRRAGDAPSVASTPKVARTEASPNLQSERVEI